MHLCGAKIKIRSHIAYLGYKSHTSFVEILYGKRMQAKAAGNKVKIAFYKLVLNTAYGKLG